MRNGDDFEEWAKNERKGAIAKSLWAFPFAKTQGIVVYTVERIQGYWRRCDWRDGDIEVYCTDTEQFEQMIEFKDLDALFDAVVEKAIAEKSAKMIAFLKERFAERRNEQDKLEKILKEYGQSNIY